MKTLRLLLLFSLSLLWTFTAIADTEPNNSIAEAEDLALGVTVNGSIGSTDLEDFYLIVLPGDGLITMTGTSDGGLTHRTYLYNSIGSSLGWGSAADSTSWVYDCAAADTFYVRMFRNGGDGTYTLNVTFTPAAEANDSEPNNILAEAQSIVWGTPTEGHLGYVEDGVTDGDDWYVTVVPADGQLKLTTIMSNSLNTRIYLYNNLGSLLTFSSVEPDTAVLLYDCYGADTAYIRVNRSTGCGGYTLTQEVIEVPEDNDVEPNNTLEDAHPLFWGGLYTEGHLGYETDGVTDLDDYYTSIVPTDGKLSFTAVMSNGLNIRFYLYNNAGSQIAFSGTGSDTVTLEWDCYAADTVSFRVHRISGCGGYTLTHDLVVVPEGNDSEPNNTIDEAQPLAWGTEAEGHLGYALDGVTDTKDWYSTIVPEDGRLTLSAISSNTLSTRVYLYNGAGSQLTFSGTGDTVSVTYDCLAADTVYYWVNWIGGCGGYTLTHTLETVAEANDAEPNNVLEDALPIAIDTEVEGHSGYITRGSVDAHDWYYGIPTESGKLQVTAYMSNTLAIRVYVFNKAGSQLGFSSITSSGDTLYLEEDCLLADTVYLRVTYSSGCGGYRLTYTIEEATYPADAEPNNVLDDALPVSWGTFPTGQIGYSNDSPTDQHDYYSVVLPDNGRLVATALLYESLSARIYLFNKSGSQLGFSDIESDTAVLAIDCIAADTVYLRMTQSSGCGSYELSYVLESPAESGDAEPNNVLAEATSIVLNQPVEGHLGYSNGTIALDSYDWYGFTVSDTGNITLSGICSETLTCRIYLFNDAGSQLTLSNASDTVEVSYFLPAAGTYYARVTRSGGCGGYTMRTDIGYCISSGPPVNLSSSFSPTTVDMMWEPIQYSLGCQVQGRPLGAPGWGTVTLAVPEVSMASVPLGALSPGTTYEWKVRCACSISPLQVTAFSVTDQFSTGSARELPQAKSEVTLSPNPASTFAVLDLGALAGGFSAGQAEYTIEILDLNGRVHRTLQTTDQTVLLNLEGLAGGMYLVAVQSATSNTVLKLQITSSN